ncbi:hypothetical protein [Algibacter lectus]|uniref:hypothetical protein n=1 Tax=Algibacter lectus TaxID=221126 RepID=UPI00249434A4|nr:hypothetical protein [Algibacter lectus]
MVELIDGNVVVKTTLEGENDWVIAYAFVDKDRLYVYLMENVDGDACPLHIQIFSLF